ncbi:MBL fold metallo-hydrolase [Pacificibacter marinus]|uniref:MBL fold metallo-hydrolase n=1 Tax=Pacificibacter marinus TaxID=658057 RepID=UPI001C078A89|nr:MBL fold metallo-hydrolase [Pacificibacter marinus]MBU2866247.1 MBL fold metallo-hydrolase [Pacificibacter marinus]
MERPETVSMLTTGLIRVIAPNPSPMTYWGTNSYILGTGAARVLIDPGPKDSQHQQAMLNALPHGTVISHILVTHAHKDHSGGAQDLAQATGAKVLAFGDARSGRSEVMTQLAATTQMGGGEGVDMTFEPDVLLKDGQQIETPAGPITALHTPGHMGNHLCFAWNNCLFSGDLIMGWSSSLISPPDGDAAAFRDSCHKLLMRPDTPLFAGHGAPVESGHARINALLVHRAKREQQILQALEYKSMDLKTLTKAVYGNLESFTLKAAARNTLAHLIDLKEQSKIEATPNLHESAVFSLAENKV